MKRFTHTGKAIGNLNISKLNQLMGFASYSILRQDLINALTLRAHALGIQIHYKHNVTALRHTESHTKSQPLNYATVTFDNGKTISPQLIIGADGRMKSYARQYVHGNNTPIYQGFINWVGTVEMDTPLFDESAVHDYWGIGKRFGIVPLSTTKAYWAGGAAANHIEHLQPANYKAELNHLVSGWPEPINQVINNTPSESIHKIYVHDHNPINVWHKHNVLLLGDAAHAPLPTSGQGACQALEDAWQFTQALIANKNDIQQACTDFTQRRHSKTSGIIMAGRQLAASIFNTNIEYCQQRNEASKNTNYNAMIKGMAKGWASGLPLMG